MKKYFYIILSLFFGFSFLSTNAEASTYAQFSSLKNQISNSVNSKIVALDNADGMTNVERKDNKIVVKTPGVYFIMAAAQVGATEKTYGNVDVWLVRNGEPIANTNTKQVLDHSLATAVLVSQTLIQLKKGDTISVAFSATPSFGLVATPAANGEPAIPSIIFSMFMI